MRWLKGFFSKREEVSHYVWSYVDGHEEFSQKYASKKDAMNAIESKRNILNRCSYRLYTHYTNGHILEETIKME